MMRVVGSPPRVTWPAPVKIKVSVLFGSETGNAEALAKRVALAKAMALAKTPRRGV